MRRCHRSHAVPSVGMLLLVPVLAQAASVTLTWEYPRTIPVTGFVVSYAGTATNGPQEIAVPVSTLGSCGTQAADTVFCATLPLCPSEDVMFFAVQAVRGTQRSQEAPTVTCVFTQTKPCACLSEAEAAAANVPAPPAPMVVPPAPAPVGTPPAPDAASAGAGVVSPVSAAPVLTLAPVAAVPVAAVPAPVVQTPPAATSAASAFPPALQQLQERFAALDAQQQALQAQLVQDYAAAVQALDGLPRRQAQRRLRQLTKDAQGQERRLRRAVEAAWKALARQWDAALRQEGR